MKILLENYALEATITSTSHSANYHPRNLTHPFLRKRYQNQTGSDLITFLFPSDRTINSIYLGFHNADEEELLTESGLPLLTEEDEPLLVTSAEIVYRVYNLAGSLLLSGTINMLNQFDAVHFADTSLVRRVTLEIKWDGLGVAGYLGGVGIGRSVTMPSFNTEWSNGIIDNSFISSSNVGQVLQNYIEPQDQKTFSWSGVTTQTFNEIKTLVKGIGSGRPVWVDFYEESHDQIQPIYATVTLEGSQRSNLLFDFNMTFTEAR